MNSVTRHLTTILIFYLSDFKVINSDELFNPDTSDFSKIVKSTLFVDKSLLIKEMFSQSLFRILITAPRRFGKSANMNMVKRFLEIEVDDNGQPVNVTSTQNYKLFKDNNLQISKDENLFNEHFGRYPVLFLDFSVFRHDTNFDSMLFTLGHIVQRSFLQHNYLIHDHALWTTPDSNTLFMKFCNGNVIMTSYQDFKKAFVFLLELLYKHFNTQVFILIDDYDAQIHELLFKHNPYMNRLIVFFDKLIEDLLYCHDDYVRGSMLTGVLRVRERGMRSTGLCHFRYLLDHPFSKFYGITGQELDAIVTKLQLNKTEEDEIKHTIGEYYKGYTVSKQNITIYSPWSVLNFLGHWKTTRKVYTQEESVNMFKPFFSLQSVKDELQKLTQNESVWAKIGDAIFNDDIINLNIALTQNELNLSIDLFKVLLYHCGLLSVTDETFGQSVYRVRIPNKDIATQFAKVV